MGIYQFVTIQLAKIVFQNFRCNEINMKYDSEQIK
jgi:hypothetical protein